MGLSASSVLEDHLLGETLLNTAADQKQRFYFTGVCILGVSLCLASWGWLYWTETSPASEIMISTPIHVSPTAESPAEKNSEPIPTKILVSNRTTSPLRVVGFSARCVCIERLFELPRELLPGEETALAVNVYLPLPEGGTPAIVFIEQGATVWKRKVEFQP